MGFYAAFLWPTSFLTSDQSLGIGSSIPRFTTNQRNPMGQNNSPLESLAAFAIVFIAGALTATSLLNYIEKIRRDTIVFRR
jgi:ABC-type amino acid transport system permease subunit